MSDDLHRKFYHLQTDALNRKEGNVVPNNWRELYLKRNVKKKQMKTRNCELCRISFNNYIEVKVFSFDDG